MIPIERREFVHGLGFSMLGLDMSDLSALAGPRADAEGPAGFGQPGSQVDCVGWCLDEGNIAAYPGLLKIWS